MAISILVVYRFGNPSVNVTHGNGYLGSTVTSSHSVHALSRQKAATLPGANRTRRPPRASGVTLPVGSTSVISGKSLGVMTFAQPGAGCGNMGTRTNASVGLPSNRVVSQIVICCL